MTYHLFILGCQQNYYDAERIAHFLDEMGYVCDDEKNADLIIVLACSVRQSAVDRIYGKLQQWKNQDNDKTVILTACVLPTDRKKLEERVDAIIETDKIEKELPRILNNMVNNAVVPAEAGIQIKKNYIPDSRLRGNDNKKRHAFLSIMSGCDNFCSYCAVPYTRGRERSRPMDEIICEAKTLVKNGTREITLLGQNVNSYNHKVKSQKSKSKNTNQNSKLLESKNYFVKLLKELEEIKRLEKISFLTSHPKDMSRSLIEWMGKSKKFSRELHLPVQSGDDEILKKMNRHYTAAQYLNLVKQIRKFCPEIKLSTDIIVGFPGETEKQFENTIRLRRKIGFKKAYVSQYSPRPDTVAAKLKDDVPKSEKKRRWQVLDRMINKIDQ